MIRATRRTKHTSPQNNTTKTRTLEVRPRIRKNCHQDGKGKKPQEEGVRQNPLVHLEHRTLTKSRVIKQLVYKFKIINRHVQICRHR